MNTVQVVTNVPIVWAWDFVMSVNFVETVQPCVPMRIAHFAKGVPGRFVITAGNVLIVHTIFSVKVAAFAVNVVGNLFV